MNVVCANALCNVSYCMYLSILGVIRLTRAVAAGGHISESTLADKDNTSARSSLSMETEVLMVDDEVDRGESVFMFDKTRSLKQKNACDAAATDVQ